MTLQSVDQAAMGGHRPMSLLLQALKQIELKPPSEAASTSTTVAKAPAGATDGSFAAEPDMSPGVDTARAVDASAFVAAATFVIQTATPPNEISIDVVRHYDDAEAESELALAEPFELPVVPLTAPQQRVTTASTRPCRGARRLGEQVLGLLPDDSRAVVAIVSLGDESTDGLAHEVCRGLAALDIGEVLSIGGAEAGPSATRTGACFAEVASGRAPWRDAIAQDTRGQFSVLPRGDLLAFRSASRRRFLTVWQELGERFAYIVIELPAADLDQTLSILATCDAALIALGLNETKRADVERLAARIRSSGCDLCGCLVR